MFITRNGGTCFFFFYMGENATETVKHALNLSLKKGENASDHRVTIYTQYDSYLNI